MTSRGGGSPPAGRFHRWIDAPEVRLAFWGFGLNLVWEALQSPLYADWQREWRYLLWSRLHCTVGDVLILLFSFWGVSLLFRNRRWLAQGALAPALLFVAAGFGYTVWSEALNTGLRGAWEYAPAMPRIFGLGLAPLAQWVVVPAALLFVVGWRPRRNKTHQNAVSRR